VGFDAGGQPFAEWTEALGSEGLTGAILHRLAHHVRILEIHGEAAGRDSADRSKRQGEPSS